MTRYEHYMERIQHCKDVAAQADDERIRRFHEDAAEAFHFRVMCLTIEEASQSFQAGMPAAPSLYVDKEA